MASRARKVVWSSHALLGVDEVLEYVARDSREAAKRLLQEILETASSLKLFAGRGRLVPEIDEPQVRELFIRRYRLIYRVETDSVILLAFIHGARDYERWRKLR